MYIGLEGHRIVHSSSDNTEVSIDDDGDADKSCNPSSSSSSFDSTSQKTIQTNRDNMTGILGEEPIGYKRQKIDEFGGGSSSSSKVGEGEKEGDLDDRLEEENKLEQDARDLREAIYLKRMENKYVMPILPTKEVMIARPVSSMKVHSYIQKQ